MRIFERIRVQGFRRLHDVHLKLKPLNLVTIDINEHGAARATRADELDLESWLEDYTLDQVWQMGRMGARS